MGDDELNALWAAVHEDGQRLPLLTAGEARAVVAVLHLLGESDDGELGDLARDLALRLGSRTPAP